jgi:hypothetical protein
MAVPRFSFYTNGVRVRDVVVHLSGVLFIRQREPQINSAHYRLRVALSFLAEFQIPKSRRPEAGNFRNIFMRTSGPVHSRRAPSSRTILPAKCCGRGCGRKPRVANV